jgi:hypothetical protein
MQQLQRVDMVVGDFCGPGAGTLLRPQNGLTLNAKLEELSSSRASTRRTRQTLPRLTNYLNVHFGVIDGLLSVVVIAPPNRAESSEEPQSFLAQLLIYEPK